MKIVCESCGAKYSIADEKVAGKVFKIRCKRCSEVIVVRGDQEQAPAEAEPAAGYEAAPDAVWHVVINGDQQGPYTPAQLGEMITNGTVDWEAYVWMEGFDNWAPMRDVENLVAQITGGGDDGGQAAAASTATAAGGFEAADPYASQPAPAAADPYASQPSMGADPFADEGDGGGGSADDGMFGGGAAASAGPDLFGAGAADTASPFDDGGGDAGVVASAPGPRVDESAAMTGVRNENSVLFSLKNLQALATGSNAPAATAAPSGGDPFGGGGDGGGNQAAAGFATGEGSGLIDIRALASTTGMGGGDAEEGEEKDELLSIGNQTAGFGALGASPMLATSSDDSEGGNKTLMIVGIASAAVVAAAGMVTFALLNKPAEQAAAPAVAPVAAAAAAAAPAAEEAKEEAKEEAPSEGELAAKKAAEEAEAASTKKSSRKKRRSGGGSKGGGPSKAEDQALLDDKPSSAPARKKPRGGDSIDDLLSGALGGGSAKPKPKASSDDNLKSSPGRSDVIKAMNSVKSAVKSCAKGATGTAIANITVKGKTGRVSSAQIDGQTGAVGSCIARAVRKARFPKFKNDVFKVKYPFRL